MTDGSTAWEGLAPRFAWRPSQQHVLDLAAQVADRRWHLCAPPGAGKTLLGLELARRVAAPTLVLSPAAAVREQWREATAMFGADPGTFTTRDPDVAAPLLSVTYQLLGNPGQAADELRAAARRRWLAELAVEHGRATATSRASATEAEDPARARREIGRHVRELRRGLAAASPDDPVPRAALLGKRATELLDVIAGREIGCIVLDECHHLLDWWALVVAALIERLGDVAVIGLTATLPDPDDGREAANYAALVGEVDVELHTAALVAEGALAPWRDGVRVTAPTDEEAAFLDGWAQRCADDLDALLITESFLTWAVAWITGAGLAASQRPEDIDHAAWSRCFDRDPLLGAALVRWWRARTLALPEALRAPPGADGPLELDDRLVLLDGWLHDPAAGVDADLRRAVGATATTYGITFTTAGVRRARSVADLVCSRSSAKGAAAADILAEEARRRGGDLRALVVVEHDAATTPPAAARAVLDEDAGTGARALASLCSRADVVALGVIAVTGRGAWADALAADDVRAAMTVAIGQPVRAEGSDVRGAVRLVGEGGGWTPARWLAAAEAALDGGVARVLLATRGLVGEGWDHPALDVLVDLSEAATRTSAVQLRGRVLRRDPRDPDKVASLWDVVVAHPAARAEWDRLRRRHEHWWGPDAAGLVVTGCAKLHPLAALPRPPDEAVAAEMNAASLAAVADVAATLRAWSGVDPGGVATAVLDVPAGRVRRTVRTRPAAWPPVAAAAAVAAASGIGIGVAALAAPAVIAGALGVGAAVVAGAGGVAGSAGVAGLALAVRGRRRDARATLRALGEAVIAGLVATGDAALGGGDVRAEASGGGTALVVVGVDDLAATRWADALSEVLGPLGRPRWLVLAPDGSAWRVPTRIGATRAAAEAFASALRRRVPGAELVRAGDPRATAAVLDAARRSEPVARTLRWH